jgi:hypothetical protein
MTFGAASCYSSAQGKIDIGIGAAVFAFPVAQADTNDCLWL